MAPLTGTCCESPSRITVTVDCAVSMSQRARWPNVRAARGTTAGPRPTWAVVGTVWLAEKPVGPAADPGATSQTGSAFVVPGGTLPLSDAASRGSTAAQSTASTAHVPLHSATKVAGCTVQRQSFGNTIVTSL